MLLFVIGLNETIEARLLAENSEKSTVAETTNRNVPFICSFTYFQARNKINHESNPSQAQPLSSN